MKLGEDGGWVFASVGAGSRIQWLPWFIYEGTVNKGPSGKREIVRMRANPPRIEIPFSDGRAKYLYELFYVPPGPDGAKRALRVLSDGGKSERGGLEHRPRDPRIILPNELAQKSNRDIKLVSFVIEKTDAPLIERVADVPGIELPPWDLLKKPPDRSGARVGPAPIIYRLSLERIR